MKIDFKEQIKRWFPTLTKKQLQLKVDQLKKEAAQMAQTPDVSLHQYRTKKWAPLSRKTAENLPGTCPLASMSPGIKGSALEPKKAGSLQSSPLKVVEPI